MPHWAPVQTVRVGVFEVTYLPDGGGALTATALFPGTTPEAWAPYSEYLNADGGVVTTIGGYVIRTPERLIIVDLGLGPVHIEFPGFGPMDGGRYLESLAAAGVDPDAVTDVFFTHMHLDHVGWTTVPDEQGGEGARRLLFPNARYTVSRTEWETWRGGDNPAGPHPEFVQKPLEAILQFVAGGDELAPGIAIIETPGHTPGHLSLILASEGQRLVLTADLLHCPAQVTERGWGVAFDMDPNLARASREAMYTELVQPDTLAAVNHFSNQVFGHFRAADGGYIWEPIA